MITGNFHILDIYSDRGKLFPIILYKNIIVYIKCIIHTRNTKQAERINEVKEPRTLPDITFLNLGLSIWIRIHNSWKFSENIILTESKYTLHIKWHIQLYLHQTRQSNAVGIMTAKMTDYRRYKPKSQTKQKWPRTSTESAAGHSEGDCQSASLWFCVGINEILTLGF